MQVVFAKPKGFIGALIKWFTTISWVHQCRVAHVVLRYSGTEAMWMLEANEKGFCPSWWHYFIKKENIFAQYDVLGLDEDVLEKIEDVLSNLLKGF